MSGDRFELELREVLRDEAAHAPVTLTMGELRARAGSRPGFGRWFGTGRLTLGVAAAAIAAIALLISLNPERSLPSVGASASASSGSSGAAATASSSPAASFLPISLGGAGTAIVVGYGDDSVDVMGSHANGSVTPIVHIVDVTARLGGWRLTDASDGPGEGAISSTGVLALGVTRGDVDHPEYATAILPLFGLGPFPIVRATGSLAFERDGTLVIAAESVVRAQPPYDSSRVTDLPSGVVLATTTGGTRISLMADGTGFYGVRQDAGPNADPHANLTPVAISWDRSGTNADPSVDPLFVTGADRAFGADGQTAFLWTDDSGAGGAGASGLAVAGPATPRVETKIDDARAFAWSRDGRTLYVITGTSLCAFDGHTSRVLKTLGAARGATRIVGLTPESVLVQGTNGLTIGVRLDGSGEDGIGGTVVGVVG